MITNFYPHYLRQLFTNRTRELVLLQSLVEDLQAGKPRRLALWGLRRVGKTLVLQEQIIRLHEQGQVKPVYMDFEDICTSPEAFAQRYVGLVTFWALENAQGDVDRYLTVERLLEAVTARPATAGFSTAASQTAGSLLRELSRAKPDQALLLKMAFEYPEKLAQELNLKMVLFLDEFTEISTLSHYPQVREPLKHFRAALAGQTNVAYVVAGSAMTAMMKLFQSSEAPLFLQFETLALEPFGRQDAEVLMHKLGSEYPPDVYAEVYRYTAGFPFYITALMQCLERLQQGGETVSAEAVRYAFLQETLWRGGQIYNYCRYVYDLSLQRARGYGMLKAILQSLAEEQGTLSTIARAVRKSPSAVREYLRWLSEVDLVEERDRVYQFRDAVLRFWVAYASKGIEIDALPRREDLAGLVASLEERFQRTAGELGRAKEAEVRELLRHFSGQVVPGTLFGKGGDKAGNLTLPHVSSVEGYRSSDGQVELDALAVFAADAAHQPGGRWAVSVKWRSKRAGRKELEQLAQHAADLGAQGWIIARDGFTPDALDYAHQTGLLTSSGDDLVQLAKLLKAPGEAVG